MNKPEPSFPAEIDLSEAVAAEQALCGLLLAYPEIWPRVGHVLPEAFAFPAHGLIWAACGELIREGQAQPVASLILRKIAPSAALDDLGGGAYLGDLGSKAPMLHTLPGHAEAVMRAWQTRQMTAALGHALKCLSGDPLADISNLQRTLDGIGRLGGSAADLMSAQEAALDYFDNPEAGGGPGLMCGLACIDRRLGGLKPGHLLVIGGRPGMGKTALARNILYGASALTPGKTFAYFSLEMTKGELTERAVSALSWDNAELVTYSGLGKMTPTERKQFRPLAKALPRNARIDDRKRVTVDDIRRTIWTLKAKGHGVGAVVIDYLQLMTRPDARGRNEASVVGEMTAELKRIAGETGTCIILLSQLNRKAEERDDKRPMLSDLRESGNIEQDANAVMFCFRPNHYQIRDAAKSTQDASRGDDRVFEAICAKNRGGPIGNDACAFYAEFDLIRDAGA